MKTLKGIDSKQSLAFSNLELSSTKINQERMLLKFETKNQNNEISKVLPDLIYTKNNLIIQVN